MGHESDAPRTDAPTPDGARPDGARPDGARPDVDSASRGSAGGHSASRGSAGGHSEHETLAWLNALLPPPPKGDVWSGDDAAAVAWPGSSPEDPVLLLTADTVVAGLDADLSLTTLSDLGWKAMAVNLSDIAAMGGTPGHALISVVGAGPDELRSLYEGILEAAEMYDCPVVGGDLSAGSEMVVSVSLTGRVDGPPVLRSGARPGDTIWVTGQLGAAAAGLRLLKAAGPAGPAVPHRWSPAESDLVRAHARPRPALAEGGLARRAGATAMIDVSDGLVADLSHIANLSGVGFELVDVPVANGATLAEALAGGDDYVLAFTMPAVEAPLGPAQELPAGTDREPEPASKTRPLARAPGTGADAGPADGAGITTPQYGPRGLAEAFERAGLPQPYLIGKCLPDPSKRLMAGRALEVTGWDHSL